MGSFDKFGFIITAYLLFNFISCNNSSTQVMPKVYEEISITSEDDVHFIQNYYTLYFESAVTWIEAYKLCKEENAELISIETQREFLYINTFLNRSGMTGGNCVWTSGSDSFEDGKYIWMANGKPISQLFFEPGQPSDKEGKENCVDLCLWTEFYTKYYLNDRSCTNGAFYLCKKEVIFQ